jgi:hypothetical protein
LIVNGLGSHEDPRAVAVFTETSTQQDVVRRTHTRRLHAIHPEPAPPITWGTIEPLCLATSDGEEIGACYVDGEPSEPVVLLLHGHGGCRGNCLDRAELAASWGCSVMMISLLAHGDSTGDYDDIGYSARHEVVSAVNWIQKNHPDSPVLTLG